MRVLPSGTTAQLVELGDLDAVMSLYAALLADRPVGVVDLVPAARTLLVVHDPALTSREAVERAVRAARPQPGTHAGGPVLEVPVTYDGEDLSVVAGLLGWETAELVRRHTRAEWTVAFCGFTAGFGYLTSPAWPYDVARRASPRTSVPAGSVGLAGEFSGVYPTASPGGWQLLGRTALPVFDPTRDPAALLAPGTRVRFVDAGRP
jgi:KipI family sensor histidine kinase inhibitor